MTTVIKKGYITEKQAAKLLGKNQKWMQNNRYKPNNQGNRIPFIKHQERILYNKSDVVNYKATILGERVLKPKDTSLRAEWERKGILNSQPKEPFSTSPEQDNTLIRIIAGRILKIEDKFLRLEDKFAKLEEKGKHTDLEKPTGWLARFFG